MWVGSQEKNSEGGYTRSTSLFVNVLRIPTYIYIGLFIFPKEGGLIYLRLREFVFIDRLQIITEDYSMDCMHCTVHSTPPTPLPTGSTGSADT